MSNITRWWLILVGAAIVCSSNSTSGAEVEIVSISIRAMNPAPDTGTGNYHIEAFESGGHAEKRLFCGSHHFCSIITTGGILAFRPHPGVDRNGWGTTLYLQPFISGAAPLSESIDYSGTIHGLSSGEFRMPRKHGKRKTPPLRI